MKKHINLNELSEELKIEVRNTLKAFDSCTIVHEDGRTYVTTGCALKNNYAPDFWVSQKITAKEVFTAEEQIINYIETFHEFPIEYKGNKDWSMLKSVDGNWDAKFKFDENKNIVLA